MATSRGKVSILIDAKDRASREIGKADGALGKLKASAKVAAIALTAVATAAGVAGAAMVKLASRGGDVVNVQRAFNRVFPEGERALQGMRDATRGLISDYDLMVQANRAVALGAVTTTEQFNELAEAALTLGRAQGVDAKMALESLALGIGRQSRLLLDNLGIIVSVEQANEAYAASLGKSAKNLTDAERAEAFRTAALEAAREKIEQLGGVTETAADNITRIGTAFKNARDDLATFVAESPSVGQFFTAVEGAIDRLLDKLPQVIDRISEVGLRLTEALGLSNPVTRKIQSNVRQLADARGAEGLTAHRGVLESRLKGARQQLVDKIEEGVLRGWIDAETGKAIPDRSLSSFVRQDPERLALIDEVERLESGVEGIESGLSYLEQVLATFNRNADDINRNLPTPGSGGGIAPGRPGMVNSRAGLVSQRGLQARLVAERLGGRGDPSPGLLNTSIAASVDPIWRKPKKEAEDFNDTLMASVGAFQAVSMAAIRGAEDIESILIPSIANIAAASIGGPWGAAIGAVGAVVGSMMGNDRPRVVVDEYGPRAERQMQESREPVRSVFLNGQLASEEQLRQLGYRQGRIARLRGESPTGV